MLLYVYQCKYFDFRLFQIIFQGENIFLDATAPMCESIYNIYVSNYINM